MEQDKWGLSQLFLIRPRNGPPLTAGGPKLHISKCQISVLRAGDLSRESAFLQVLISQRICSPDTLELPEHLRRHACSAIRGVALSDSYLRLSQTRGYLTKRMTVSGRDSQKQMFPRARAALNIRELCFVSRMLKLQGCHFWMCWRCGQFFVTSRVKVHRLFASVLLRPQGRLSWRMTTRL